jgi:hypothetical protein
MSHSKKILRRNVGVDWTRTKEKKTSGNQINLEKIFMEEWNEKNTDRAWINSGLGVAQLLMIVSEEKAKLFNGPNQDGYSYHLFDLFMNGPGVCVYNLTEREQRIIATIIQWLGTNVGFGFILKCLKRAGYVVHERLPREKPPESNEKGRFWILKNS